MVIKNILADLKFHESAVFFFGGKKYEIIKKYKQTGYNFLINDELWNDFNEGVSLNTIKKWLSCIKKGKEISNYN